MISFPISGGHFNFRAAGVCIDEGHVLLHRSVSDDFWSLPVGRVELGEDSSTTLRRELCEELGVDSSAGRLLWIVENFFTYGETQHHELGMYYLVSFKREAAIYDKTRVHEGLEDIDLRLIFRWFPLDTLPDVLLFPTFLRNGLRELPLHPTHIVHIDRDG